MRVIGCNKYLVQLNIWSGGTSLTWLAFAYVNKSSFPLLFHEYLNFLLSGVDGCSIMVIIMVIC